MTFRAATPEDETLFYEWRRTSELQGARGGWWKGQATTEDEHHEWFTGRLGRVVLLVWESSFGRGIVRIDSNGELAFDATHPRSMLEELLPFAEMYGGRLKATVDDGDTIKQRALEAAGFVQYPVKFYAYRP